MRGFMLVALKFCNFFTITKKFKLKTHEITGKYQQGTHNLIFCWSSSSSILCVNCMISTVPSLLIILKAKSFVLLLLLF